MLNRFAHRHGQRGFSLVELMVGIAIGLIIVAAASVLMTTQLFENRRLIAETQMQQDLRAATDLMAREMRRVDGDAEDYLLKSLWHPGGAEPKPNRFAAQFVVAADRIDFSYLPTNVPSPEDLRFQLQGTAVKTLIGGNLQELTDPNIMKVTKMATSVDIDTSVVLPCPNRCTGLLPIAGDDTSCWPRYEVRRATIVLQAEAKLDSNVKREITSSVRLRNDRVRFSNPVANLICPA